MNLIAVYVVVLLASLIAGIIYGWRQDGIFGSLIAGALFGGMASCLMLLLFIIGNAAILLFRHVG